MFLLQGNQQYRQGRATKHDSLGTCVGCSFTSSGGAASGLWQGRTAAAAAAAATVAVYANVNFDEMNNAICSQIREDWEKFRKAEVLSKFSKDIQPFVKAATGNPSQTPSASFTTCLDKTKQVGDIRVRMCVLFSHANDVPTSKQLSCHSKLSTNTVPELYTRY